MTTRLLPRYFALAFALTLAVASQTPATADDLATSTADAVKARLAKAESRNGVAACVLVDLNSGETLFDYRGDELLAPASNLKVITSAAALTTLGREYEFVTRVYSRGEIAGGKLTGDLCIVGGGDPNISGRFHDDEPLALYRQWAAKLKAAGVTQVSGNLLYDSTLFGGASYCEHWPQDDQYNRWYCAEVSALAFNDNCIAVKVTAGEVGGAAKIEVIPPTAYVTIVNETKTVSGKGPALIDLRREKNDNVIRVKGNVATQGGGYVGDITVCDPARFAATVFRETLESAGIAIAGKTLAHTLSADEVGESRVLVEHRAKLMDALKPVNTNSQNLHAEMLLRQLGLAYAGKGTFKTGIAALSDWLKSHELWHEGMAICDGSGLAAANRVSARSLAGVLALMAGRPEAEAWRKTFAVGGESGTLKKRMKGKLKGKVVAKTGYIAGVRALSGYLEAGKRNIAFSMLLNRCSESTDAEDDVLELLADALG